MKYFRFYPDCHYVFGTAKSTLYDLSGNKTILFSKEETEILRMWMNGTSIEKTENKYGATSRELLETLLEKAFGTLYDDAVYSEPYFPVCKWETQGLFETPPNVKLAYIQINAKCDEKCNFCGDNNMSFWQGCNSCLKWPNGIKSDRSTEETIKNLYLAFDQLIDLEVEKLIFSGGNPLRDWKSIENLIKYIKLKKSNTDIIINTNGRGFNDEVISFSVYYDITYCFTILSNSREGYKKITNRPELYDEVLSAIEKCKENHIMYSVCLLVTPDMEGSMAEIMEFAESLGGLSTFTAEIFSGNCDGRRLQTSPTDEKRIEDLEVDEFFFRRRYNTCLAGTIAYSANGRTLPCPMWDSPIGELPEKDLHGAFKSGYVEAIWRYSKFKVPVCKDCENKYACSDCSVLEWASSENSSTHNIFCTYIPELGIWK